MMTLSGQHSGLGPVYKSTFFPCNFLCFSALLVFKPKSSVYHRNNSPSASFMNLNCEGNASEWRAQCSFPGHNVNPFPTQKTTVLRSWFGWLVPRKPIDQRRSSSVALFVPVSQKSQCPVMFSVSWYYPRYTSDP